MKKTASPLPNKLMLNFKVNNKVTKVIAGAGCIVQGGNV